ncbi:MAG: lysylphosphatidylglycerol synthase transmembrane domain-containing protein [Ilumatobacteraceae bacterium]
MFDWIPAWLRWTFGLLVVGMVVWWFVIPQFGEASEAYDQIRRLDPYRPLAAGALVFAAFVAQAQITRAAIEPDHRPGTVDMVRIELASAAVSHTVPGGTAAGTALGYRLLTDAGVPGRSAGFAVGVRGIGSAVVLNGALWLGLAVWIPANGFESRFGVATAVGVALIVMVGLLVAAALRWPERIARAAGRILGRLPLVDGDQVGDTVVETVGRTRTLVADRRLALRIAGWAGLHWLAEVVSLWLVLAAFGWSGSPLAVFIAFGVVNVLAVVPITPRGLGIVEAVLIPMLVALGAPGQVAALGVLTWRLLSFWAPIAVGTVSYVSLRVHEPTMQPDRDEARRRAAEELASARRSTDDRSDAASTP